MSPMCARRLTRPTVDGSPLLVGNTCVQGCDNAEPVTQADMVFHTVAQGLSYLSGILVVGQVRAPRAADGVLVTPGGITVDVRHTGGKSTRKL